jgi:hypothetical protein
VAVLIDADNAAAKYADVVMAEAGRLGTLSIKRAYGDWNSHQLGGWRPHLLTYAIQPVQQFS